MSIFLGIVIIVASLFMIATVLLQSSNVKGLGAVAGELNNYFGKNKGSTVDAKLALGTKIAAAVFVVASLLFLLVG